MQKLLQVSSMPRYPIDKPIISQNGFRFRSICAKCNNEKLGLDYDPSLADFVTRIKSCFNSSVILPETIHVTINPGRVARALIGHIYAIGNVPRPDAPIPNSAYNFFSDINTLWPNNLDVFFWIYPYQLQIGVRCLALSNLLFRTPPILFDLLKFFPVAFMIVWDIPHEYNLPHVNLRDYAIGCGDHDVRLPIRLSDVKAHDYPETPKDWEIAMFNDNIAFQADKHRVIKRNKRNQTPI